MPTTPKPLTAAAALLLCLAVAACGGGDPAPASPTPATAAATAAPAASPTATPATAPLGDALAFDPAVVRGELGNGLSYYIRRNGEPRGRAHLSLVVKAGSVLEEEQQRGLAHFVEHMAFNGTERFAKQEIVDYLESIGSAFGPDLNARTGHDSTLYFLEIPTDDPDVMETAFQILSDWAYAISFSPDEVELERMVVLEEWRLSQGLSSRLQESLFPLLLGDSRYAERSPIGLPEVIESAPPEDLRAYYERWYRPSLMAVVAVGDFDPEVIEAQVRRHFAPPPEGEAQQARAAVADPVELPSFAVPDHDAPRVEVFSDPESPVTQVVLFRKVAPESGRNLAAFRRVVAERLAYAMVNARLFERGQSADPPYLGAGGGRGAFVRPLDIVTFSVTVEAGGAERGFGALLEELERVRRHGFTAAELERAKANLLSSAESAYLERDQQRSGQLAQAYANHFLSGTPELGVEAEWELYQAVLPQVSLAEVEARAAAWTEPENSALLVLRPEGDASGPATDGELAEALRARFEGARALSVEPYEDAAGDAPLLAALPEPGVIVMEERLEAIDAVRWRLSNGVTVIARQTDFRNDEVLFGASSPGGHSLVADADHVSAQHASQLAAGSGAGAHDRVALDRLLAGKRVSVAPYISELFEGLRGSASPDDLETLFQLIALYVTEPRFDADYFATYEAQLRSAAETRAAQPDTVFYDTINAVLSQDHFRHRPLTLDVLDELSLERAEAVYAERFADVGDATFVFVGAFDWDELRALTAMYLAGLPSDGRVETWRDVGVDPPLGVVERTVRKGLEPRSQTALVFAGEAEWSAREALTLSVAGEMLGIRLRERVREELGGTYSINAFAGMRPLPDAEYQVGILFGSDPARVDELVAEVAAELEWLRAGGEQSYLDTVKEVLRTSREEQLRSNGFWLGQIEGAVQRGEPFAQINRFDEWLEALTLEDIADAARRYLPEDRYVRVVLLPEAE